MNWQSEYSFDGRYFDSQSVSTILDYVDPL
ncbi:MAG: hypothetical protein ISP45_03450 [Reyranella sp.]|nr:hypothetical protein [Reyranella sp.]